TLIGVPRGAEVAPAEIVAGKTAVTGLFGSVAAATVGRAAFAGWMRAGITTPIACSLATTAVGRAARLEPAFVVVAPAVVHLAGAPVFLTPAIVRFELFGLLALAALPLVAIAPARISSVCHVVGSSILKLPVFGAGPGSQPFGTASRQRRETSDQRIGFGRVAPLAASLRRFGAPGA